MDAIKTLLTQIALIFRFVLPGAIFVLALLIMEYKPPFAYYLYGLKDSLFWVLVFVSWVLGSLIYCVHQGLIHLIFANIFVFIHFCRTRKQSALWGNYCRWVPWGISKSTYEREFYKWYWSKRDLIYHQRGIDHFGQTRKAMDSLSDRTHFLYCSAYAIALSNLLCDSIPLWYKTAGVILFAAICNDLLTTLFQFAEFENSGAFSKLKYEHKLGADMGKTEY